MDTHAEPFDSLKGFGMYADSPHARLEVGDTLTASLQGGPVREYKVTAKRIEERSGQPTIWYEVTPAI